MGGGSKKAKIIRSLSDALADGGRAVGTSLARLAGRARKKDRRRKKRAMIYARVILATPNGLLLWYALSQEPSHQTTWQVDTIDLWKSEVKPDGAVHTLVASQELR